MKKLFIMLMVGLSIMATMSCKEGDKNANENAIGYIDSIFEDVNYSLDITQCEMFKSICSYNYAKAVNCVTLNYTSTWKTCKVWEDTKECFTVELLGTNDIVTLRTKNVDNAIYITSMYREFLTANLVYFD